MFTTILDLLYNFALLVALSVIAGFIRRRRGDQWRASLLQGLLFGGAAVVGMMRPLVLGPGLIFDGRSVMISLCGLFFGPLAAAVAGGMAALYRIYLGGPGVQMGVMVVVEAALLGLVFHHLWTRKGTALSAWKLLGVGVLVHVVMVLLMFTLPAGTGPAVIKRLGLPILLVYPLITILIGMVLSGQEAATRTVEALHENEERLRLAMEATSDGLWDWNITTGEVYFSPAYTRMLGYEPLEFQERVEAWTELIVPEDREHVLRVIQDCIDGVCSSFEVEYRVQTRDGSLKWILGRGKAMSRDEQGRALRMAGTHVDLTERKLAEEALRRGEERFRAMVETIPLAIHLTVGIEQQTKYVNPTMVKLFGYSPEDIPTIEQWWPLAYPDETYRRQISEEWTTRVKVALETQTPIEPMEVVVTCKDGSKKDVSWGYITLGDQNYSCGLDLTERKQAEAALHLSEQKFRTLFENLTEGVALHELVTDETGKAVDYRILDVNPAYQHHTGLKTTNAPGLLGTVMYGTEVPPYLAEFSQVALGGEPYAFETFFPPLEKHFRISVISPRHGQFATVFEDITDRKRREEELTQKNAEMERFTYMVSHDLKSPLVTVRTFLGYLEQDMEQGKAERVAKDMDFIRNATGKMGRLLEDLLEVSRVGRVVNPPVRVSLANLVAEATAAVAGAISARGVAIAVEVPALTLFGDRPRLEEIWQNLVENAVKYMGDQPSPRIELGVEGAGADTVFFVRDNGLGIDPRFHDKVFSLFEKLDPATEGTGLGLALVKRIVELYEGRLWLESAGLGHGTCFRFTLPLALKGRAKEQR